MKNRILIFLKGFLMGVCDIIPGISGGTIAFITGIYQRLISAVGSISPNIASLFFQYLKKRDSHNLDNLKSSIKKLDLIFLINLGAGIIFAILVASRVVKFLLENHFAFTMAFFIGLIVSSSRIIYKNIENHRFTNISYGIIGLIIGISLAFLIPVNITPSLLYIFFCGFLAISAMFLPGISGAFLLLILGAYEFMLNVLHDIKGNLSYFFVFIFGAGLGALTISKVISYLFKKDKCKTLYVLFGLVLGSLSIPVKKVLLSDIGWNFLNISFILILFLFGFFSVVLLLMIEKNLMKSN